MKKRQSTSFIIIVFTMLVITCGIIPAQRPVYSDNIPGITDTVKKQDRYIIDEMYTPDGITMDIAVNIHIRYNNKINISLDVYQPQVVYYIYNAEGHAIIKNMFCGYSCGIDMSGYRYGEYRLRLVDDCGRERNFRIIKIKDK